MPDLRRSGLAMLAVAGLTIAVPSPAPASERVHVRVEFHLTEADYLRSFTPEQRDGLESAATQLLANLLGSRVGFLEFEAQGDSPYVLEVNLDDQDPGGQDVAPEVGFHFRLLGDGVPSGAATYWTFRPREVWGEPVPKSRPLLEEMERALGGEHADYGGLVREVLSHVKVSAACDLHPSAPSGWILPFTPEEICLDRGSIVLIRHEIVTGGISEGIDLHARYAGETAGPDAAQHRLFCVPAADEDRQRAAPLWTTPDNAVTSTEVYVVDYEPRDSGCAPAVESPAGVSFGGGQ
jgi:hypothetical protein